MRSRLCELDFAMGAMKQMLRSVCLPASKRCKVHACALWYEIVMALRSTRIATRCHLRELILRF